MIIETLLEIPIKTSSVGFQFNQIKLPALELNIEKWVMTWLILNNQCLRKRLENG